MQLIEEGEESRLQFTSLHFSHLAPLLPVPLMPAPLLHLIDIDIIKTISKWLV